MENFEFYSPTRMIFGKGEENRVGEITREYGKKVLLHYGSGSIKKNGIYDRVTASLRQAGVEFVELGGVQPNPRYELCMQGVELCKKEQVDFILAVGGGSVIDSAKFIAVAMHYDGDAFEAFNLGGKTIEQATPIGVVLTIAAAGSEASKSCVINKGSYKRGLKSDLVRPKFAILNPELTFSLPRYQMACGAVDIMAHVMERYFSPTVDSYLTDQYCEGLLKTVIKYAPIAYRDAHDYNAHAQLMWAGTQAHNDICGVGRAQEWTAHQIEHELSAKYDIAHGAGLAVVFPAWMEYVMEDCLPRFVAFAVRVWGVEDDPFHPLEVAKEGIRRTRAFYRSIGMPTTMQEIGAKQADYSYLAEHTKRGKDGKIGTIKKLDTPDIQGILQIAHA